MKHYAPPKADLVTAADVKAELRRQLDGHRGEKGRLAERLGITRIELSQVLGGHSPLRPGIAEKLGYRKVTRFEKFPPHERTS